RLRGDRERVIAGTDCGFGTFAGREYVAHAAEVPRRPCSGSRRRGRMEDALARARPSRPSAHARLRQGLADPHLVALRDNTEYHFFCAAARRTTEGMMSTFRLMSALLIFLAALALADPAGAEQSRLDTVTERGRLIVAAYSTAPPLAFKDAKGEL